MADVAKQLEAIDKAIYGRDVRSSIHDAISAINGDVEACAEGEKSRSEAEAKRESEEEARAKAEAGRESAEEARAKAEEARVQGMKDMEGRISGLMAATGAERVHVCVEDEYADAAGGAPPVPDVADPKSQVVYLTPVKGGPEHGGFAAWLYVDGKWESLGGGTSSSPLAVEDGGTGATDAEGARENLSVYSKEEVDGLVGKGSGTGSATEVTGTSLTNKFLATVTAIDRGAFASRVTLKHASGATASCITSNDALDALGTVKGSNVFMAFGEHAVSIADSITYETPFTENVWEGSVEDVDVDTVATRVRLSALGGEVYAVIPTDVRNAMGLDETSGAKLYVSPFDIFLLKFTRDHNGGSSTPDTPTREHAGGSN